MFQDQQVIIHIKHIDLKINIKLYNIYLCFYRFKHFQRLAPKMAHIRNPCASQSVVNNYTLV